jgi:hypothetical protein
VSAPPADELHQLRRLLGRAMAPPTPSSWERPATPLLQSAAAAYLLLDRQPPHDAATFVTAGLEQLVRELARSGVRAQVASEQGVRGRVLWSATTAARAEAGGSTSTFVYHEVRQQFDLPENQLLRLLIERLLTGLAVLPPTLRRGVRYAPHEGRATPEPIAPVLERVEAALRRARASAGMRGTRLVGRVEPQHLLRAETARNEGYAAASRIYRRYAALSGPRTWRTALGSVGRRTLLLPAGDGPDDAPWIELAAIALRGG